MLDLSDMKIDRIIVEIHITGSIISKTDDGILIGDLCGSFDLLPLIVALYTPNSRKMWYSRAYAGTTTPSYDVYLTLNKHNLSINYNQLQAFMNAIRHTNMEFIDFNMKFIKE